MERSEITHALAAIHSKVSELQIRSSVISVTNGLRNSVWAWCVTLLLLGSLVLVLPIPGFVRASLVFVQGTVILWVFWRATLGPILFRRSRKDWALYCEELHPRLNKRLVTCLDIADAPDGPDTFHKNPVAGLLLKNTSRELARFEPSEALSSDQVLYHVMTLCTTLVFVGVSYAIFPTYMAGLFTALYNVDKPVTSVWDQHAANKAGVGELTIEPGNIEIARGDTVEFSANIVQTGYGKLEVIPTLHILNELEESSDHDMLVDETIDTKFNLAMVDVQSTLAYHATVSGLTTQEFTITLYDPPAITEISAKITPPEYSNDPVEEIVGTYFAMHQGSSVVLTITSDQALTEARLVPDDGDPIAGITNGKVATFTLTVDKDQSFRGVILDESHHQNLAPPLIEFEAIPDKTPSIRMIRPGADWSLHPIGELEMTVEVNDDNRLRDVQLEYQINDGEVQIVELLGPNDSPTASFSGDHTLTLENLDVELGDVVLYRLRARDARPDEEKSTAYSQPYFLTIRPFDQEFLRGGSAGEGEVPPMPNQKEVIIATTRLIDREPVIDSEILADRSIETADTQKVIEDRTEIVLGKMKNANVPDREARVRHLEQAIEAMQAAQGQLKDVSLRPALSKENSALSHLLAAYAGLPKGVPNQMKGGGQPPASMNLLGQKLDKETQKYETSDGLPTALTRELDEAIAKTKILAQRQKEFAETIRREREAAAKGGAGKGSSPPSESSEKSPSEENNSNNNAPMREMLNKEEMLAALEESQRELQKLKDAMLDRVKMNQEMSKDLEEALRTASREMKRLNNAMRNDDFDEAQGANTRTLEKLREVQLALQQEKLEIQDNAIQALLAQVDAWKDEQSKLSKSTASLGKSPGSPSKPSREAVSKQQSDLAKEATETGLKVSVMTPMPDAPDPPDYISLGRRIGAMGRLMKQASKHIESEKDLMAEQEQLDVMEDLDQLQEELNAHLLNQTGDEMARLRLALDSIQAMRLELETKLKEMNSGGAAGELQSDVPPGSPGEPAQSDSQPGSPAPGQVGSSGVAPGIGRINSAPKDGRSNQNWADNSSSVAPTRIFDKRAMTVKLETIQYLLGPNSAAIPLIRTLEEIVASDMWGPPTGGAGPGDTEFLGEFAAVLKNIEEIMAIELAGGDQLQRLNQSGVETLPPRFREIASAYFESLAEQAQKPRTQKDR